MSLRLTRPASRALATSLALGVVLALGACAPAKNDAAQPAASAAQADPDKTLDQITVGINGSLSTLNTAQTGMILNYYVGTSFAEGLVGVDAEGQLVPALAESWAQPDDTTWVYQLRDAKFSDGTPVTVEDVIFSINLFRDAEKSPSTAYYWPELESVEKTGDREITIKLAGTSATFGWTPSAAAGLYVTSQKSYEAATAWGSAQDLLVTTGPFKVTEFAPDSHVQLERNADYWGAAPKAEKLRFDFITDDSTRLLAFQEGKLDLALGVPVDQVAQWEKTEGARIETVSNLSYQGLTFDSNLAPFDDVHARNAVAHAIDRTGVVDGILKSNAEVATGITSPEQLALNVGAEAAASAVAGLPQKEFDLDKAKAELAQSATPEGFTVSLTYPDSDPSLGKISLALAENLKELGITLDVKEIPSSQWGAELGNGEQPVSWMSYTPPVPTDWPTDWLLGEWNPALFSDPAIFELQAKAATTTDPAERVDSVIEATRLALEETYYAPVFWGTSTTAVGPRVVAEDFTSYFFLTSWPGRIAATS